MGYAEDFEKWLDDDLQTLERCSPADRATVEGILSAWAGRPARAVALKAFFSNWATAVELENLGKLDTARGRAEQALRLDDKYRRLREKCDALLGGALDLPPSILESRSFWEQTNQALQRESQAQRRVHLALRAPSGSSPPPGEGRARSNVHARIERAREQGKKSHPK